MYFGTLKLRTCSFMFISGPVLKIPLTQNSTTNVYISQKPPKSRNRSSGCDLGTRLSFDQEKLKLYVI